MIQDKIEVFEGNVLIESSIECLEKSEKRKRKTNVFIKF